jgi:hypothetical protein
VTRRWLEPSAAAAATLAYWGALAAASRGLTVEKWDGIQALMNGVSLLGAGDFQLNLTRPPLGWALLAPFAAAGYAEAGPAGAFEAARLVMPGFAALLAAASYWLFRRRLSIPTAAALALVTACDPLLLSQAPFVLFDAFAGAAALPFLWASWRAVESPTGSRFAAAFAAYVAAVLARYQLAAWILVPIAGLALRSGVKKAFLSKFWLFPPAAYPVCAALTALLAWAAGREGAFQALAQAERGMRFVISFNAAQSRNAWWLYFEWLDWQMGVLLLFALPGLWAWLRDERGEGRFFAAALLVPFGLMSLAAPWKEERYLLQVLPLLYAAVGEGFEAAWRALGPARRYALVPAFALLALAPWKQTLDEWKVLREERALRTTAHWRLADVLRRETPPKGCIGWEGLQATFFESPAVAPHVGEILTLGPENLSFLAGRDVYSDASCGPFVVEARSGAGPVALVHKVEGGRRRKVYEVYPYDLVEWRKP